MNMFEHTTDTESIRITNSPVPDLNLIYLELDTKEVLYASTCSYSDLRDFIASKVMPLSKP